MRLLLQAFDGALESQRGLREFAVELSDFQMVGIPKTELRWLVSMEYAEHLLESTPKGANRRKLRTTHGLAFSDNSCFILTENGAKLARDSLRFCSKSLATTDSQPAHSPSIPRWDAHARELWLGPRLVKRIRVRAPNQERILAAFQEEGWPTHIDDPLPLDRESEGQRKLHDAINKLNKHQQPPSIHFRGDGTGKGVCYEIVSGH